jgi:hypothetical protein
MFCIAFPKLIYYFYEFVRFEICNVFSKYAVYTVIFGGHCQDAIENLCLRQIKFFFSWASIFYRIGVANFGVRCGSGLVAGL